MNGMKISRISWIETLFLKNSPNEHFSQLTNFVTVVLCSLLLILSAKIKVDLYPVPMTLQPLAVLMIAMLCGRNISVAAVSLYLFQGMVGFQSLLMEEFAIFVGSNGRVPFWIFICFMI